jgi:hypothetical protein
MDVRSISNSQLCDVTRPSNVAKSTPSVPPLLELDARLDEALCESFPASDPVAVSPAAAAIRRAR